MPSSTLFIMILLNVAGFIIAYRGKKQLRAILYNPVERDKALNGAFKFVRYVMGSTIVICIGALVTHYGK